MISRHQRRIGRRNFVAVDAVGQPHQRRKIGHDPLRLRIGGLARIRQPLDVRLDLRQTLDIGLRPDGRVDQLATFPGLRVFPNLHPVRIRRGQGIHVLHNLRVRRNVIARLVAEHFLVSRNGRIVSGAGPVLKFRLCGKRKAAGKQGRERTKHSFSFYCVPKELLRPAHWTGKHASRGVATRHAWARAPRAEPIFMARAWAIGPWELLIISRGSFSGEPTFHTDS